MNAPIPGLPGVEVEVRHDTDLFTLRQIRTYAKHLSVKPTDIWLDGGMNIGAFSVWATAKGARVIGIEPEPTNFELAVKNLTSPLASPRQGALIATASRPVVLNLATSADSHSLLGATRRGHITVDGFNINDLIATEGITVVKLDVEGAELDLIPAISATNWQQLRGIVFEYHGKFDHDGAVYARICGILRDRFPVINLPVRKPTRYTFLASASA